jgi:hypothetical protein
MSNSKGDKFFDAPYVDELLRMNTELLAELWIVKDRLMVMERVLCDKLEIDRDEIDRFVPDAAFNEELDREREIMMKRVMHAPFAEKDRRVETILNTYLGKGSENPE